ncbi:MAG: copper resistance protein B [Pseudomonadota bacterium]
MKRLALLLLVCGPVYAESPLFSMTGVDRLEYLTDDIVAIEADGWIGRDLNKFVWKFEGESGDEDEFEVQLLYGRALTAFFDLQLGVRFLDDDVGDETSLAIGIEGDAPYNLELDVAAFIGDDNVEIRAEVERDFWLTSRWVLQPRIELEAGFDDDPERLIDSGLTEIEAGVRLRYELNPRIAPYLGVAWHRRYLSTADESDTSALAGVSFWF